jgi:hypothetical protein
LEALASSHGLEFVRFVHAAHRHLRRKATDLPEAVTAELNRLEKERSTYGAGSAPPPPGTFRTSATVTIDPHQEAAFHHATPADDDLDRELREAAVERVGDRVRATAHADLRLGDLISVSVMTTADRQESDRRWADWKSRGADTDNLPKSLPMRITRFLRVSPTEVIEVPPDHPGTQPFVSYLIGSASLAEVLAGLGREDAIPDWLTLPGVPAWWTFPAPEPDPKEEEDGKRLEQWCRTWIALAPVFARMDDEHSRTYERIERTLTEADAAEVRRLVCEEGQREPAIGQAFRAVWEEFVAEPGARPDADETVGRHLCAVVAAHYGEELSTPPWKRPEEPAPPRPRRGKGRRPAVDVEE